MALTCCDIWLWPVESSVKLKITLACNKNLLKTFTQTTDLLKPWRAYSKHVVFYAERLKNARSADIFHNIYESLSESPCTCLSPLTKCVWLARSFGYEVLYYIAIINWPLLMDICHATVKLKFHPNQYKRGYQLTCYDNAMWSNLVFPKCFYLAESDRLFIACFTAYYISFSFVYLTCRLFY